MSGHEDCRHLEILPFQLQTDLQPAHDRHLQIHKQDINIVATHCRDCIFATVGGVTGITMHGKQVALELEITLIIAKDVA